MSRMRFRPFAAVFAFLPALASVQGCQHRNSTETVSVSIRNTETYKYPTVSGDEEGARISTQAKHYSISEIRRNAETGFVATYVYQPASGFVGSDYAEIEILTGSDGASAPTNIKRVAFQFVIHD
jgi:hypothetical protein